MEQHTGRAKTLATLLGLAGIVAAGGGIARLAHGCPTAPRRTAPSTATDQGWSSAAPREDRTLTFHTADWPGRTIHFTTRRLGHRVARVEVTLAEGAVDVYARMSPLAGGDRHAGSYHRTLHARVTHVHTLEDMPREGTLPIQWRLTWDARHDPKVLTVTLQGQVVAPGRHGTLRTVPPGPDLLATAGPAGIGPPRHGTDTHGRPSLLSIEPGYPKEQ